MAYESFYWKQIIKRDINYLRKKLQLLPKEIDSDIDKHFSQVEIKVMTLAYVVRKLADTHKLPDRIQDESVKVNVYPRKNTRKKFFAFIFDEYDMEKREKTEIKMRYLCNQIIHSYVLQAMGSQRRAFKSVLFVSDYMSHDCLYEIEIETFLKAMEKVANSDVIQFSARYDDKANKWIYKHE